MRSRPGSLAFTFLMIASAGCGYHTAGRGTHLPQAVHVIAVPTFTNQTHSYRLEQVLTGAVVREFGTRARYRIIPENSVDADAVLRGTVVSTSTSPLTYDAKTGRASTMLVTVNLKVEMLDRNGAVIYENPNYAFREQYQVSREISSFFDEESPALDRLARDFARTLVSNILEGF